MCAVKTKYTICYDRENFEEFARTYQQARYKATDLESEIKKP